LVLGFPPTISLPFANTFLTICLLSVACAGWIARCEGSHFGVAGSCLPFPYHLLTLSLPFAYYLLHVQDGQQDVRGTILGLLAVAYHFLTMGGEGEGRGRGVGGEARGRTLFPGGGHGIVLIPRSGAPPGGHLM